MNTMIRKPLKFIFFIATGALALSCADYNETDGFSAQPDPSFKEPYSHLAPVKTYLDRAAYPNMSLGATLSLSEFNKQELAHSAAMTNFDEVTFGKDLMPGSIINGKGVMNFEDMKDLLEHMQAIKGKVFGSPIAANNYQADEWLDYLTSPVEAYADYVECEPIDYNTMTKFEGTVEKGKASIAKYDNQNTLKIEASTNVYIVEGFDVSPLDYYNITIYAKADKKATFSIIFSGTTVEGTNAGKFSIDGGGGWKRIIIERAKAAAGVTQGYIKIENTRATPLYIQKVEMGYMPDNHRPQTEQEVADTLYYAMDTWCNEMMEINAGRITSFDLIDEALGTDELENGMLDLKHSTDKFYWQDIFGSENYAPTVSRMASAAFEKHGGNPADLKFFIAETGLEDPQRMQSLNYWIKIWESNKAKIDGINAKVSLTYSENPATLQANKASLDNLLENLAATGKLVRISNFDIKYLNAEGGNVAAENISDAQRQQLADYYAYVIKSYMTKIPHDQQAGICKANLADTKDPVGLWSVNKSKDWVRNATYEAFCNALSGK